MWNEKEAAGNAEEFVVADFRKSQRQQFRQRNGREFIGHDVEIAFK